MERLVCVLTHLWGRSICEVTHLHHKVSTGENADSFQNFMRRFSQTFFFRKTFIDIFEGIWNLYFNIFKCSTVFPTVLLPNPIHLFYFCVPGIQWVDHVQEIPDSTRSATPRSFQQKGFWSLFKKNTHTFYANTVEQWLMFDQRLSGCDLEFHWQFNLRLHRGGGPATVCASW